ncbi:MAG: hypothetical protein RL653_2505 [Pseudomonadota bacterium]
MNDFPLLDDSVERWDGLEDGLSLGATEPAELLKVLSRYHVLRGNTHYQVAMNAKAGVLHCRVPGGRTQKITLGRPPRRARRG